MNKKVLSAILFGALMAGTGTFTSCIDNEEPASITTLRGAKAELLKAKAAVEQAKVAQVQAEAEVARAQAALLQAQAAAVEAKAQSDKALADAQLAEAQARAEQALAQAEKARLEAEAAYQKSILDLKKAQAELVGTQQETIAPIVTKYEEMLKIYFEAIDDQTEAERALAKHISVMEEKEASKALLTRELSREVTMAEKAYAGEQAALALAQEVLADAEALEPHELAEKAAELEAKKNEIDLAVADLKLEAAKALVAFYEAGRHQEVSDLYQEVLDFKNEEHTIPEFEFDYGDGAGLPMYAVRGKYTLEEGVFTYNDLDEYNARKDHYEDLLERLNSWVRDENDNAWTEERILELEAELEGAPEKLEAAKKAWAEAVAAYNTGKYNEADPTKISGYEDVVASITAFNTAVTAYNTARGAQAAADTKAADQTTMQNAKNQAWSVYTQEVEAADKARKEALGKLSTTIAETKKALEKAVTDAGTAVTTTKAAYDKLYNESTDAFEIRAAYNTWQAAIEAEKEANKCSL